MRNLLRCLIYLLLATECAQAALTPVALRCEYLDSPMGLDEMHPRLTWRVDSGERGEKQTAYQILVASDEKTLNGEGEALWDSGKVASDQTVNVVYGGKPLSSRAQCFWKVKVWDKTGKPSAWSEPTKWTMGLLRPEDWTAEYISFKDTT